MSAHVAPGLQKQPRVSHPRTAKQATQRRVSHKARARYSMLFTFCVVLVAALSLAMLYVTLTSKLTSLSYAYARAERQRATLQAQAARLDDELAALHADDRLARLATRLHMVDPQQFALIDLPRPAVHRADTPRLALLSGLAGLLRAK
jgi:cell division protein FtsL